MKMVSLNQNPANAYELYKLYGMRILPCLYYLSNTNLGTMEDMIKQCRADTVRLFLTESIKRRFVEISRVRSATGKSMFVYLFHFGKMACPMGYEVRTRTIASKQFQFHFKNDIAGYILLTKKDMEFVCCPTPPKPKQKKRSDKEEAIWQACLHLSKRVYEEFNKRYETPLCREKINAGADVIRLLHVQDKWNMVRIEQTLFAAMDDEFWAKNFRSLNTVRKKSKSNDLSKFENMFNSLNITTKKKATFSGVKVEEV